MIDVLRAPGHPPGGDTCFCGCGRSTAFGRARELSRAAAAVVTTARVGQPGARGLLDAALAVLHRDEPCPEELVAALRAVARG